VLVDLIEADMLVMVDSMRIQSVLVNLIQSAVDLSRS